MTAEIVRFPSIGQLMRREANARAVEQAPHRSAEQIQLIGKANAIAAAALGRATVLAQHGKKDLARERLLIAARDVAELYERCRIEEINMLACTLVRSAHNIRVPRRRWRQHQGSLIGFLR